MHSRSTTLAIFGVFFFESAVIGQWIPRIPDIKAALELSDAQLGLALLAMPLGTLLGFSVAGRMIELTGLRNACRLFLPLWAFMFIGPGIVQELWQLALSLVLCGVAIGMIETAMNTEAARIERAADTRLMSRCHGFWSLGTMIGALIGGAIAQAGIGVGLHFMVVLPIIAVLGYVTATALPVLSFPAEDENADHKSSDGLQEQTERDAVIFRLPSRAILLLCIMPMGIMMVEGAFIDWSAVFMREVMSAEPFVIAVIYSAFSLLMALVRLSGDALAVRFGDLAVVRYSGIAATLGIAMFALSPNITWAFFAAALSGAGVAIVFPIAVTAAANREGRSAADNVAALNMISFSAFLISPPLIGFISEWLSLRYAMFALTPIALLTVLMANEVTKKNIPNP